MMVMISNCTGYEVGVLCERYNQSGDVLGHLLGPGGDRGPYDLLPIDAALDNDGWVSYVNAVPWNEKKWRRHVAKAAKRSRKVLWGLVPDVVGQRLKTLEQWEVFAPVVRAAGIRPAFAVQDDMTFDDVPDSECMLFLGGTTPWKEAAIEPWCARFPERVHVGRVTEAKRLWKCYEAGAVSIDGNGWMRKKNKNGSRPQREVLIEFLEQTRAQRRAA